ncbi:hypothetical protein D9613_009055 [Agrocybe pediades]|uniref:CCHC-type domain-containing protein n=1 Tax=Agrocybe pediades TaxID=84607 RepID=A0A8H4R2M9_9AGAR|nr:hypothetical protein D9613_009055 [Agrocybe pediades]
MDALVAVLTTLVNNISALFPVWNQQAESQQEIAQAVQAQAMALALVQTTNIASKVKMEAPAVYDGNTDRVTAFMQEMEVYLQYNGVSDLSQQIYLTLARIRGGTGNWATIWSDNIRANVIEHQARTPPVVPYGSWNDFKAAFTRQFRLFTSPGNYGNMQEGQQAGPSAPRDPNAMDVDSNKQRGSFTCYKCGKPGHMARNCRSSKAQQLRYMFSDMEKEDRDSLFKEAGF